MENVYSSVSSNPFKESVEFATQFIQISDDDLSVMTEKPISFESTTPWIKKSGGEDFDLTNGCFDGVETC